MKQVRSCLSHPSTISFVGAALAMQTILRGLVATQHHFHHQQQQYQHPPEESDDADEETMFTATPACPFICVCSFQPSPLTGSVSFSTNCSYRQLDALPADISERTEVIDLSGNPLPARILSTLRDLVAVRELFVARCRLHSVSDLTPLDGARWTLTSLDASDNQMTYLQNRSFVKLPLLRYLRLADNKIESIHFEAFTGLSDLEVLDLSGNRISSVDGRWFCHLSNLTVLNLTHNIVHVLVDGTFHCASNLVCLDLGSNRIVNVYDLAFEGLDRLRSVSLIDNSLGTVPVGAIRRLSLIEEWDLSGNNFEAVQTDDFRDLDVRTLRLNRLKNLRLVQRHSFVNLTLLEDLELAENPKLRYIDGEAFTGIGNLRRLSIHCNELETLEEELISNLKLLDSIDVHSNPLYCDCVLQWLYEISSANNATHNLPSSSSPPPSPLSSSPSHRFLLPRLLNPDLSTCRSPSTLRGMFLSDRTLLRLPVTCGPRVLPIFAREATVSVSESVRLHCRAVGIPRPNVTWHLPDAVRKSTDDTQVDLAGTLTLESVNSDHQGIYTCVGASARRSDSRTLSLRVRTLSTVIVVLRVTSSSVTVTWRGVDHTRDHLVTCSRRRHDPTGGSDPEVNSTAHPLRFAVKPYMRSYTISDLLPDTEYDVCISVRRHHGGAQDFLLPFNCTTVTTRNRGFAESGLRSHTSTVIGGGVACLVGLGCVVGLAAIGARRYDRKKRLQQQQQDRGRGGAGAGVWGAEGRLSQLFLTSVDSVASAQTFENKGAAAAAIFDEADLEEIRSTASMKNHSTGRSSACGEQAF